MKYILVCLLLSMVSGCYVEHIEDDVIDGEEAVVFIDESEEFTIKSDIELSFNPIPSINNLWSLTNRCLNTSFIADGITIQYLDVDVVIEGFRAWTYFDENRIDVVFEDIDLDNPHFGSLTVHEFQHLIRHLQGMSEEDNRNHIGFIDCL